MPIGCGVQHCVLGTLQGQRILHADHICLICPKIKNICPKFSTPPIGISSVTDATHYCTLYTAVQLHSTQTQYDTYHRFDYNKLRHGLVTAWTAHVTHTAQTC